MALFYCANQEKIKGKPQSLSEKTSGKSSPKPSVGPSHFLSVSLSISERGLALRWLSQSAVNEEPGSVARSGDRPLAICQADLGSSRAAVNEVVGTHLQMPERPQRLLSDAQVPSFPMLFPQRSLLHNAFPHSVIPKI